MKANRARLKGRSESGRFAAFPLACAEHGNYLELSGSAVKLLHDMLHRYNGRNNGDISIAMSVMKARGWSSSVTLAAARDELEIKGWVVRTTSATRKAPVLYALTFRAIDECGGKLEVASGPPLGYWKEGRNPYPDRFPKKISLIQKVKRTDSESESQCFKNESTKTVSASESEAVAPDSALPVLQNLNTFIDLPGTAAWAANVVGVDGRSGAVGRIRKRKG